MTGDINVTELPQMLQTFRNVTPCNLVEVYRRVSVEVGYFI